MLALKIYPRPLEPILNGLVWRGFNAREDIGILADSEM